MQRRQTRELVSTNQTRKLVRTNLVLQVPSSAKWHTSLNHTHFTFNTFIFPVKKEITGTLSAPNAILVRCKNPARAAISRTCTSNVAAISNPGICRTADPSLRRAPCRADFHVWWIPFPGEHRKVTSGGEPHSPFQRLADEVPYGVSFIRRCV